MGNCMTDQEKIKAATFDFKQKNPRGTKTKTLPLSDKREQKK